LTPEARRLRTWGIILGVASSVALIAVALLVLIGGSILAMGNGPRQVVVPSVAGQPREEALKVLSSAGLEGKVLAEIPSDTVPPGAVIGQRPYVGKQVKEGRLIELTVSTGPKTIKVPEVTGKPQAEAQQIIEAAYLKVGTVRTVDSDQTPDTIIEQQPEAGTVAERDSEVKLTVSGGPTYSSWTAPNGDEWVFRHLSIVVPAGADLQRVRVVREQSGNDTVLYDELHRPGDKVEVDVQAPRRAKVKVYVEENQVFSQRL
jgi:serine/threonine-protein kinase